MRVFKIFQIIVFSFSAFLQFSCNSVDDYGKSLVIDVESEVGNYSIQNLGDYVKNIEYIRLETIDSSVLGSIGKIFYERGLFYITDNKNLCKIFDRKGKYLRTINRQGRGPQEYLEIRDMVVSPETGNIMIIDSNGVITEYDVLGNFIRKIPAPDKEINYLSFIRLKNNLFVASTLNINLEEGTENGFIIYDDTLKVYRTFNQNSGIAEVKSKQGEVITMSVKIDPFVFIKHEDMVRITRNSTDTLFLMSDDFSFSPSYIFNFGKFRCDPQVILSGTESDDSRVITKYPTIFENDNFIFMNFKMRGVAPEPFDYPSLIPGEIKPSRNTNVYGIYNKKKGSLTLLKQPGAQKPGLKDDIKGGPPFWPRFISSDKEMINCYNAIDLILLREERGTEFEGLTKITEGLREEDNPVIVVAK